MLTRRSVLGGAARATAVGLLGRPASGSAQEATPQATPIPITRVPLWQTAWDRGLIYGTSLATWQVEDDAEYLQLVDHEAALLFTEDDLLWWRLKPTPDAELD